MTVPFRVGDGVWVGEEFMVIKEVDFEGQRIFLEFVGGPNDGINEWWPMSNIVE